MPLIIDGEKLARAWRDEIKQRIQAGTITPRLAVIQVGDNPASSIYVTRKLNKCLEVGIKAQHIHLAAGTTEAELLTEIQKLNDSDFWNGVLIQLPLPASMNKDRILSAIDPRKDVDGLSPNSHFIPCTPLGCMPLIHEGLRLLGQPQDLKNRQALVVGQSNLVGRPMTALLRDAGCIVKTADSRTTATALEQECRQAQILVVAVGHPSLVKSEWIKDGAVVIDVGINRLNDGKIIGDIDAPEKSPKNFAYSPVPGGVGPMTIAALLHNTVRMSGG